MISAGTCQGRRGRGLGRRALALLALPLLVCLPMALPAIAATDPQDLSLEQLLEIKIVGPSKYEQKQSEVAAAPSIITRDEIKAFGWRTLGQALASLPGVFTTYDRQYTYLGFRGLGLPGDFNTRVLVTIDGNRLNDATFDSAAFGRDFPLNVDLIERIEFIPGPGGAVYGQNAMLAVVNIVTRKGSEMGGGEAALGYQHPQSLIEGRASWGERLDNGVDFLLSASGMGARGQNLYFDYGAAGIAGVANGLDGDRNRQVFGSIRRGPWSFELVSGFEHKDDPTGSFYSDPLVPGQYKEATYTLTQSQYQDRFLGDTLELTARLFTGDAPDNWSFSYGGVDYGYPSRSDWWGFEARAVSTALAAHTLMLGVEAQDNYRLEQGQTVAGYPGSDFFFRTSGNRLGVYGQDELRLSGTLAATLGLRVDHDDVTGTKSSPRAGIVWQLAPTTTAKALYGIAHRSPNAYEDLPAYQPGPTSLGLSGEAIDTLEFDVDHRFGPDLALRASLYRWALHDLVLENGETLNYQNEPPLVSRGAELSTDKTWVTGARLRASVSLQDAGFPGGGVLINSPRVLGKLDLSGRLPVVDLRGAYELDYDGRRATLDGSELGGYTLSSLYLIADGWAQGLAISLGVANLFGKSYAQPASVNNWQNDFEQDGRSVSVKVTCKL